MSKEMRITGPPGTGKTTTLATKIIPMLAEKYGPEKVMITSFTKAAAHELSQRINSSGSTNIGTLHSMCYKALKHPPLTQEHIPDWNQSYLRYSFAEGMKVGPTLFAEYQVYRNKMIPRDKWNKAALRFAKAWEAWKNKNFLMDFIDLIESAGNQLTPPGSPSAIVVDESQDLSLLEITVLRRWATQCKEFWVVGDANQCQPAGSMISTINGQISIENIDPQKDKLRVYIPRLSLVFGGKKKAFSFQKTCRKYSGIMYNVKAENFSTECTDNHLWYVKWDINERVTKWNVVYLMERNSKYRIGWCQLFRKEGNKKNKFHIVERLHNERAASIWILKLFDNKSDASMYESFVATEYGFPLLPFIGRQVAPLYTQSNLDNFFNKISNQKEKVLKLLTHHNLNIRYPFYKKRKQGGHGPGKSIFKIATVNIAKLQEFANFFIIPVKKQGDSHVKWSRLSLTQRSTVNETVYSLDVEKYHTYVSNNICTCNCIYEFSGASAENMLKPDIPNDQKMYLKQSYRVPQAVHKTAMKIISRVAVRDTTEYNPRDFEGSVTDGVGAFDNPNWLIREVLKRPGTSMIAASCNYMLAAIINELRNKGIPFSNPWRKESKEWNPLDTIGADVLLSFLSKGEDDNYWNTTQFLAWASHVIVGDEGLIRKQGKTGIKQLQELIDNDPTTPGLHTCREYIDDILSPGISEIVLKRDVKWLQGHVTKKAGRMLQFPARVLSKQGKEALFEKPHIFVGTCHSFKGTEATNVFLYPDLSFASIKEMETQDGYDNICRLFYVGVTRAKENLILMPPLTSNHFKF